MLDRDPLIAEPPDRRDCDVGYSPPGGHEPTLRSSRVQVVSWGCCAAAGVSVTAWWLYGRVASARHLVFGPLCQFPLGEVELVIDVLRDLRVELVRLVSGLGHGSTVHGSDAAVILGELVAIERAAAAGKLTMQRAAVRGNVWRSAGSASPEVWLAHVTGETPADVARSLTTGDLLAGLAETSRRFVEGRLSESQASLVASGAAADPHAEHRLLLTARQRGGRELRRASRAVRQAARGSQEVDRARIHATRFCRTWTSEDGGFEGRFRLTPDHGAVLASALDALRQSVFAATLKGSHPNWTWLPPGVQSDPTPTPPDTS
jgi:hypothetical protein